jgi:hypothetical protein
MVIGMAFPANLSRRSLVSTIGCGIFTVAVMMFWFTDFSTFSDGSDFSGTFWLSSKLVLDGRKMDIYPRATDTSLLTAPQNVAGHKYLPDLSPHTVTSYFYPPLVAGIYLPLAFLPCKTAFFVFQIVCIAALALSCGLLCGGRSPEKYFFGTFLYTPMVVLLWIGQSDMLLTILPYCLMYWLLSKDRPMAAGLAGSITLLKTNLALVPGFIAVILLLRRQWRMFAGFCVGGAVIVLLNLLIFGPEMCLQWIVGLKLMESDFANPSSGAAAHLAASLPRLLLFAVPHAYTGPLRILVIVCSAIFALLGFVACRTLTKDTVKNMDVVSIAFVISSSLLPLCAHYLFYYDLSALAVAGIIVYTRTFGNPNLAAFLRQRFLILWIIMAIYPVFSFHWTRNGFVPIIAVLPFIIFFVDMLRFVWLAKPLPAGSKD